MNRAQFVPCPRCATPVTHALHVNQGMGGFTYVIRCPCGLMFDTGALSEEAAAEKWNERPEPKPAHRSHVPGGAKQPDVSGRRIIVSDDAVNRLKASHPHACINAGLCERIGGRLYTRTFSKVDPC